MKKFLPAVIVLIVIVIVASGGYFIYKTLKGGSSTVVSQNVSEEEKKEKAKQERAEQQDLLLEKLKVLFKQQAPGASFSVAVYDLNNDEYFGFNDTKAQHAASVSKVFTSVYTYYLSEQGKFSLTDILGAYNVETQIKYLINQSNEPSWELIDELIGRDPQNKFAKSLGFATVDLRLGKNIMSPKDATMLLVKLAKGEIISEENRDKLFSYMQNTESENFFSPGFPQGTIFYHKTGKYLGEGHDNAYVAHPQNPFVLTVFSNNTAAPSLVGRGKVMTLVAQEVYNYFDSLK
ncbi:MAG: serine hydrolase [Candidatus Woykebacteria bacterium]